MAFLCPVFEILLLHPYRLDLSDSADVLTQNHFGWVDGRDWSQNGVREPRKGIQEEFRQKQLRGVLLP